MRSRLVVATAVALVLVGAAAQAAQAAESWSGPFALEQPGDTPEPINALSCPSPTQCTAVMNGGLEVTFDPTDPGSPSPTSITNAGLNGVACPSTQQCTAVDTIGEAITFDPTAPGSPTRTVIDPGDGLGSANDLAAVACPSDTQCTAVSDAGNEVTFDPTSPGSPTPVAIDRTGGTGCASTSTCSLAAIACPSTSQCTAASVSGEEVTFNPTAPGTPTPISVERGLSAVACPSTNQCTGVVAAREVTFNPMSPGTPASVTVDTGGPVGLQGVACPSTTQCTAVDNFGKVVTFNPVSPGTPTPTDIAGTDDPLDAIACTTVSVCIVVDPFAAFVGTGLAASTSSGSPGATTLQTGGPTGATNSALSAVSCVSAQSCMAVGLDDTGGDRNSGGFTDVDSFTESWDGSTWTVLPSAGSAGANPGLYAVSCVSPTFCVAVGQTRSLGRDGLRFGFPPTSGSGKALVEVWNGVVWTVQSNPADRSLSVLDGVSCTSTTFCVAVGATGPGTQADKALVETWNGSGWNVARTPSVARYGDGLAAVSCVDAAACTAVGFYNRRDKPGIGIYAPLIERWNGHRWRVQPAPRVAVHYLGRAYRQDTLLTGVSCASQTSCMASGILPGQQNFNVPAAERWNGSRWSVAGTGLPHTSSLSGVSCLAPSDCIAVGLFNDSLIPRPGTTAPLAEHWTGRRWTRLALPHVASPPPDSSNLADFLDPAFFGIACVPPDSCTAVGAQAVGGASAPLAQRITGVPAPTVTPAPPVTITPATPCDSPTGPSVPAGQCSLCPQNGCSARIRLPGSKQFVLLSADQQVPPGATLDTRTGAVRLTSSGKANVPETGIFYGGIFTVARTGRGAATQLNLVRETSRPCAGGARLARHGKPSRKTNSLWSNTKGDFRTHGQFAAATALGTKWLTTDSCTGTLVRVTEGSVSVRDLVKRKSVVVRSGHSYLAGPRRAR